MFQCVIKYDARHALIAGHILTLRGLYLPGPPVILDKLVRRHLFSVTPIRLVPPFTLSFTNHTLTRRLLE